MHAVRTRVVAVFTCLLLTLTITARTARAQPNQEAEERAALAACQSGEVKTGVEILARLYAQTLEPAYIYNQGRCYQQNAMAREALVRFREFLRVNQDPHAAEAEKARGFVSELEKEVQAEPATRDPIAPSPPASSGGASRARLAGLFSAGLGVVALGTGLVFALKTKQAETSLNDRLQTGMPSSAEVRSSEDDGRRYQTLQFVSLGVGAVALIVGGVLYAASGPARRPAPIALRPTLTGALVEGAF